MHNEDNKTESKHPKEITGLSNPECAGEVYNTGIQAKKGTVTKTKIINGQKHTVTTTKH